MGQILPSKTFQSPSRIHNYYIYICTMDEKEKFYRALRYLIYLVMVAIALCLIVPMVWFFIESRSMGGF